MYELEVIYRDGDEPEVYREQLLSLEQGLREIVSYVQVGTDASEILITSHSAIVVRVNMQVMRDNLQRVAEATTHGNA